jgi:hypothetical protein
MLPLTLKATFREADLSGLGIHLDQPNVPIIKR